MDIADATIVPNLPWIIGGGMLLGAFAIGGWIFTTWLRIRHNGIEPCFRIGYPIGILFQQVEFQVGLARRLIISMTRTLTKFPLALFGPLQCLFEISLVFGRTIS